MQCSLLNLSFDDSYFDHVYCVETLEHAISPEKAIRELCRVVKPGGSVTIVDKNAEQKGALEIEAWERWFERSEVESWLSNHCSVVTSEFIPYADKSEPDGLFIVWRGNRRG